MSDTSRRLPIRDIGEKRLIAEFIRPLFNSDNKLGGVGDDCAMIDGGHGDLWLFSTDRVPADLTAFRLGILDYFGLGRYLACLNLSDIAACGGRPLALLLNLGLPNELFYDNFTSLCRGFGEVAARFGCEVLGGDMTWSQEISVSATSIGRTEKARVLTRRGAKPGDTVFVSKPLGLTPAALGYHLKLVGAREVLLPNSDVVILNRQFTAIEPEVELGMALAGAGNCTSCMDNTDGIGQSMTELAAASGTKFVIDGNVPLPEMATKIAGLLGEDMLKLAFSAGADFALVGTLRGKWTKDQVFASFGRELNIVGRVEEGNGINVQTESGQSPLVFAGWNYFS